MVLMAVSRWLLSREEAWNKGKFLGRGAVPGRGRSDTRRAKVFLVDQEKAAASGEEGRY